MISKSSELALRIAVGVLVTGFLWWIGGRWLGASTNPASVGEAFITVAWVAVISLAWFLVLGLPVVGWFGQRAGGLLMPGDASITVRPEFSIAEARFQQGRYAEAIAQFRRDIVQHPGEVYPHMRIADIELLKLGHPQAALDEMQVALVKANAEESFALVTNRIVELLLKLHPHETVRAAALLEELARRYPGTKHARAAAERAHRLAAN